MDYRKLSGALATASQQFTDQGRPALAHHAGRLGLVTLTEPARPARAVVFLRGVEPDALDQVRCEGLEINQGPGTVRTGIVDFDALDAVTAEPALRQIVVSHRLRTLMDVAPGKVGVPAFVERTGLDGAGVVIGIVDTGIDPRHAAFQGRIERIWDQTLRGPGVSEGRYGLELTGDRLIESRDVDGHGTHVAGIAAGADTRYPGIAPKSRLVIVKTTLMDAHIADGVRYCFRAAAELDLPAVVNLSLGGHADPHDGTDPLSAILNAESGPGKVVVCAAGNEGNDAIHAAGTVPEGGHRSLACVATGSFEINAWYAGDDRMEVSVVGPSGAATPFQPVIIDGSPARRYDLPDGTVQLATPGPDPVNSDHQVLVIVGPADNPTGRLSRAPSRAWRIRFRGATITGGRVDAWVLSDPRTPAQFTGRYIEDAVKVGSPGCATDAITAAAYTTRTTWTDIEGRRQQIGFELEDVSDFSSEGPRRDGHPKPDVTTPGAMIAAMLSRDADIDVRWVLDAEHVVLAGTSMASPFLTGVVALLLQREPALEPAKVRERLRAASAIPGGQAGDFDPKWGYGLLAADRLARAEGG